MIEAPYHLITIKWSHYNEKARWALDRFGVEYRETANLPICHYPAVLLANRFLNSNDEVSTFGSTPVLVTSHSVLSDSSDILRYLSATFGDAETTLYPNKEVHGLEQRFSLLGDHTRRVAYFHVLPDKELCLRIVDLSSAGWQSTLWHTFFPLLRITIARALRANAPAVEKSKVKVEAEFKAVSDLLADGRRYLVDNRFTAADLAFACMAAPALLVEQNEGFSARLPYRNEVRPQFRDWIEMLRATPAGQFALRLFREERLSKRVPTVDKIVPLKRKRSA